MARRANIFVAFSSIELHPAQRAGILSKTNLYSGPLGRKTLGHLSFYKDIGPLGHG